MREDAAHNRCALADLPFRKRWKEEIKTSNKNFQTFSLAEVLLHLQRGWTFFSVHSKTFRPQISILEHRSALKDRKLRASESDLGLGLSLMKEFERSSNGNEEDFSLWILIQNSSRSIVFECQRIFDPSCFWAKIIRGPPSLCTRRFPSGWAIVGRDAARDPSNSISKSY